MATKTTKKTAPKYAWGFVTSIGREYKAFNTKAHALDSYNDLFDKWCDESSIPADVEWFTLALVAINLDPEQNVEIGELLASVRYSKFYSRFEYYDGKDKVRGESIVGSDDILWVESTPSSVWSSNATAGAFNDVLAERNTDHIWSTSKKSNNYINQSIITE